MPQDKRKVRWVFDQTPIFRSSKPYEDLFRGTADYVIPQYMGHGRNLPPPFVIIRINRFRHASMFGARSPTGGSLPQAIAYEERLREDEEQEDRGVKRIVLPRQKDKRSSFPRGGHGLHYDDSLAFVAGGYRLVIGIGRIGLASLGRLLFGGSNTPAIAGRIGSAGVQTGGRAAAAGLPLLLRPPQLPVDPPSQGTPGSMTSPTLRTPIRNLPVVPVPIRGTPGSMTGPCITAWDRMRR